MDNEQTLNLDKIFQWFKDGEKKRDDWLIGTEHEKFLFKKNDFKRLGYEDLNGIKTILIKIAEEEDWEKINEGNNLIGLKHKSGSSISLEPGGQFELSGAPLRNLHMTCNEAGLHLNLMRKISNELDFVMLGLGFDPISKRDQINWMPKKLSNVHAYCYLEIKVVLWFYIRDILFKQFFWLLGNLVAFADRQGFTYTPSNGFNI